MAEQAAQRGRLPVGGQQVDPSARNRLGDSEGPLPSQDLSTSSAPCECNVHSANPQQQLHGNQPCNVLGQNVPGYQLGSGPSSGTFNLSGMAAALPDYHSSAPGHILQHDQQRYLAGASNSASTYHQQQFSHQPPMNGSSYATHPLQHASTYQQGYPFQQGPQSHSGGPSSIYPSYPGSAYYPAQQQQYLFYAGQHTQPVHTQSSSFPSSYGSGYLQQSTEMAPMSGRVSHTGYSSSASSAYPYGPSGPFLRPGTSVPSRQSSNSSMGSIPSTPRGPPRKPKQSGHALWVGNLPSGTVVSDLKDHFSRDAKREIESVFLISKSNCAFVNYRSEMACAAAMARFHDSRFQGVRLVCRLRRNPTSVQGTGAPAGPAAMMPAIAYTQTAFEAIQQNREVSSKAEEEASAESFRTGEPNTKVTDKYFVMKSLTVEDMELSVRNSIWATQSHNEDALNKAFESSENVYLIFSANKSGEYFGVARMASPITDETAAGLDWAPRGETVIDDPDIPRSIPTAATDFAPKGRIIDDSARGTIFWEADPEDEDLAPIIDHEVNDNIENVRSEEQATEIDEAVISGEAQAFGKPFKIEWIATNRLPFYRTRGLRNPWNANREVKIARDGTEIETSVGRRLLQMFQKSALAEGPQQGWPPGQSY